MRGPCWLIGAITAADGLFTTVFSRGYIRGFWGSFRFGHEYQKMINAYASFPDRTLRIIGLAELIIGAGLLLPSRRSREQMQIEESVSKEHFSQLLRGLAESLDKSSDFQTVIKGQQVSIPSQAKMKVEYEQKEGEGELELEVKWKGVA